ncbi:amino acid permease [candidate division KSB1 bacterium]|nr:amino acid permease [candidate division KSB1 bacterium]MBL7093036.1 amino acid permease [candidate division KSB1 bacterium]
MPQLKKNLTLFDLSMIAIGSVIGSGIFLTPSLIANSLPSPMWILFVWILGGVLALTGALTYAELSSMMPEAGGIYVFLSKTFGGLFGFLFGWVYFFVVNTGAIAALSIVFSTYLGYFIPMTPTQIKLAAIAGIAILTLINVRGVKSGAIFSDLFTVLKIFGILGIILIGFGFGSGNTTNFSAPLGQLPTGLSGALAVAMVGVIWSCGGWQHTTFTAAEAKNPKRDVPFAMIIGAVTITVIYLLTNIAYLFLLSPAEIAGSSHVAAEAVEKVLGPIGGSLIALAIFISTFGTAGIYTLSAPRIYFAMAKDKVFFHKAAEIHPKYGTPAYAIIFQSTWAIILILFWGTFENLISYVVFTDAIFFGLAATAIFVLRKRIPDAKRPYKTLGYPVTPIIFIAIEVWFVVTIVSEKPLQSLAGLGFMFLGVPVYYFWKKKS